VSFPAGVTASLRKGGEGLVTFLVYEPGELALVTRVQWLGD
jgi:hypothetical protein